MADGEGYLRLFMEQMPRLEAGAYPHDARLAATSGVQGLPRSLEITDDQNTISTAEFAGRKRRGEQIWRGRFEARPPLSADTSWIELLGTRWNSEASPQVYRAGQNHSHGRTRPSVTCGKESRPAMTSMTRVPRWMLLSRRWSPSERCGQTTRLSGMRRRPPMRWMPARALARRRPKHKMKPASQRYPRQLGLT